MFGCITPYRAVYGVLVHSKSGTRVTLARNSHDRFIASIIIVGPMQKHFTLALATICGIPSDISIAWTKDWEVS